MCAASTPICDLCGVARAEPSTNDGPTCNTPFKITVKIQTPSDLRPPLQFSYATVYNFISFEIFLHNCNNCRPIYMGKICHLHE